MQLVRFSTDRTTVWKMMTTPSYQARGPPHHSLPEYWASLRVRGPPHHSYWARGPPHPSLPKHRASHWARAPPRHSLPERRASHRSSVCQISACKALRRRRHSGICLCVKLSLVSIWVALKWWSTVQSYSMMSMHSVGRHHILEGRMNQHQYISFATENVARYLQAFSEWCQHVSARHSSEIDGDGECLWQERRASSQGMTTKLDLELVMTDRRTAAVRL